MKIPVRIKCPCRKQIGLIECYLCEEAQSFQVWVSLTLIKNINNHYWNNTGWIIHPHDMKHAVKRYKKRRKKQFKKSPSA